MEVRKLHSREVKYKKRQSHRAGAIGGHKGIKIQISLGGPLGRCGPQKSRTLFIIRTQGSFQRPPTGIHPCNNDTESLRILLIVKSNGLFGTHRCPRDFYASGSIDTYRGPAPKNAIKSQLNLPVRLLVKNLRRSPGARSSSIVFQLKVLSTLSL